MKSKPLFLRIHRLLLVALALLTVPLAHAQTTNTWIGNNGAAWRTAASWSSNAVPTSTTVARFTNTTTVTAGVNGNQTVPGNTNDVAGILFSGNGTVSITNSSSANNVTNNNAALRFFGWVEGGQTNLIVNDSSSGHLVITNNANNTAQLQFQLGSGGVINVSNSGARVSLLSRIIEDSGETNTITKTGAGTLIIGGGDVNTWRGGVVLNAGVLQLNKSSALGAESGLGLTINGGSIDNGSGAAVTLSNYAQTWGGNFSFIGSTNLNLGAGAVNLTATRTVTVTANALTVGGTITNTGGIIKAGAGTLILNGANTYSGTTTVSGGTLALGNVNALQNSVLDTGASGSQLVTFTVGGNNTYNIGGLQGGDALVIGGNTLSVGSAGGNTTYSGAISGTGGALIKTGSGTLTLSGNSSYTGGTTVSSGGLIYNGINTSTAVTVNAGATLGGGGSVGEVTVNGTIDPGNSPGTLSVTALTLNGGGSYRWELTDASGIAGTGWDVINVGGGSGVITLGAAPGNQFTINVIGASPSNFIASSSYSWDIIDAGSWVTAFDSGAFLVNTNGFSALGTLGTWSVANNSGNLQLLYTAPATTTYAWNSGSGLWSASGNWDGATLPTNGSTIAFAGIGGASTNDQVSSIASLTFSNGAGSYTISGDALALGAGGIVNNSANSQILSNNLSLSTPATINAASNNIVIAGNLTNGGNAVTINGAANTTISGAISGGGSLTKSGAGTATLLGLNTYGGGTTINAGALLGNTDSLQGNISNQSFLEFSQSADGTYGGIITGAGIVTKSGSGKVTFSGDNSYNGGTIIAGGTLTGTTATVPGEVDVSSGATLALNQATDGTFAGDITGAGRFVKDGSGNVTLGGSNTYSGGTLISLGTLTGTAASLQGAITNNAALVFNQASAGTYSGAMSGSGSLTKSGAGSLTLSGNNSYSGGTLVSQGSLVGDTASLQGPITNNASVVFNQASEGTYSGAMSGSGSLTKSGNGALTLSGNNSSYTGPVTIGNGAIVAANNNALGTAAVTVTNGSAFAANGVSLANNFTIGASGATVLTTNNFTAYWNFGTTSGNASATSTTGTGISFGALSSGNNNGTVALLTNNSTSSGYTGASGQFNAGAAAFTGSLSNGSTYFEFTLTSDSGYQLSLTNFTFGSRSTTSGPQLATLSSSIDSYAAALATNGLANNSVWVLVSPNVTASSLTNGAVTFRIYGSAGTGTATASTANWRIDDLNLFGYTVTNQTTAPTGSGTLGINEAGTATFSGAVTNNSAATLTAVANSQATFSGVVSGLGSVTKTGSGTVTLSGNNTYSGGTVVSAGTLQVGDGGATGSLGSGNVNITNASSLVVNRTGTLNVSSAISGDGSLTKLGSGSLVLGGANTYTGATSILEGNLTLSLNASLTSDVTIGSLASIGGRGTITGDLFLASGADFVFDLNGPLVVNSGAVSFGGLSITDIVGLTSATPEGTYTLIDGTGTTFDFANVFDFGSNNAVSLGDGKFAYFSEGSLEVNVVPEPSTYALLALAAAGLGAHVIRRRRL